jgi:hypothetical protein
MKKNDKEYLVDDTPIDLSKYDQYTDEELEKMYQERFGEYLED